jgi:hypothetical protein
MTWPGILLLVFTVGATSYLFGFLDHVADKIGLTIPQTIGVMVAYVMMYIGAVAVLYITLAYCHKWIGPYIFGG